MKDELHFFSVSENELYNTRENSGYIELKGVRVHNLKNINVKIPRNKFVVFTGLSGSGKSSLAFDTIYAEGQRRYIDTFATYAKQFLDNLERPDIDKISGLSPVISIEQKTTSTNPRSTIGTITEIYDYLRLLYARTSTAYSYRTGEKMVKYSEAQIIDLIKKEFSNKKVLLLAPLISGRKGHYKELFAKLRKKGYVKVRVDGVLQEITPSLQLERYQLHDIELLVDQFSITEKNINRLNGAIQTSFSESGGKVMIWDEESESHRFYSNQLMCPVTGMSYDEPEPNSFSFNSPYGACPKCNGLGSVTETDTKKIIPDPGLSIKEGGLAPIGKYKPSTIFLLLEELGKKHNFSLEQPIQEIEEETLNKILFGIDELIHIEVNRSGIKQTYNLNYEGIVNHIKNQHNENASRSLKKWALAFMNDVQCESCKGQRLKKTSLHFRLADKNIADLSKMDIKSLQKWLKQYIAKANIPRKVVATEIISEIQTRLTFLLEVGLDYLSLDRPANSLSGGESQRIRLATQVGSKLVGVLYILDEPSIGLHPRDNLKLINSLKSLRDSGNSIIVVEHDQEMILAAEHIIDIGPGAGKNGGEIVAQGNIKDILATETLTAQYLKRAKEIPLPKARRKGNSHFIELKKANGHNLKNVNLKLPLSVLVCVTGVSGSGKSSLINQTLANALKKEFYRSEKKALPFEKIKGINHINKIIEVTQSPIGRTPRSNPATYTGIWDEIRKLYASLPESKIRNYAPGRFSFNVKGGRCETCMGAGVKTIEMNFLPDVHVTCETCYGKRYNRETLEIRYRGKSINDILEMEVKQAVSFFSNIPSIEQKLKVLDDIGLGYISLGQSSTTLSGGEAQRIKLGSELLRKDTGKTLYILDEPTTGLHFEDVLVLMNTLNQLVDKGNTVIIIEHNMEVIKLADHIIDMGPEGGENGGNIIGEGTPEIIAKNNKSYTGKFLKELFMLAQI